MKRTKLVMNKKYYGEELADLGQDMDDMLDACVPSDDDDDFGLKGYINVEVVQIWEEPDLPNHEFDFGE